MNPRWACDLLWSVLWLVTFVTEGNCPQKHTHTHTLAWSPRYTLGSGWTSADCPSANLTLLAVFGICVVHHAHEPCLPGQPLVSSQVLQRPTVVKAVGQARGPFGCGFLLPSLSWTKWVQCVHWGIGLKLKPIKWACVLTSPKPFTGHMPACLSMYWCCAPPSLL